MKHVMLAADGACLGNPGPGGWAALLRFGKHEKVLAGGEPDSTNNRMELMAVIQGLAALTEPCSVDVHSDSRYLINAFEEGWLEAWRENDWRTATKNSPVKNRELWEELLEQVARHRIRWIWVKGHAGNPDNERVDSAARKAATELQNAR